MTAEVRGRNIVRCSAWL